MANLVARCPYDPRIDIGPRDIQGGKLQHYDPLQDTDVGRCDPDPGGFPHRVEEVLGEATKVVVESIYGLGEHMEARVGELHDSADSHCASVHRCRIETGRCFGKGGHRRFMGWYPRSSTTR